MLVCQKYKICFLLDQEYITDVLWPWSYFMIRCASDRISILVTLYHHPPPKSQTYNLPQLSIRLQLSTSVLPSSATFWFALSKFVSFPFFFSSFSIWYHALLFYYSIYDRVCTLYWHVPEPHFFIVILLMACFVHIYVHFVKLSFFFLGSPICHVFS